MIVGTRLFYLQKPGGCEEKHFSMTFEDSPAPLLAHLMRMPEVDLLTASRPILTDPLSPGASRLYFARLTAEKERYTLTAFKNLSACLLGFAVATFACIKAESKVGGLALKTHAVLSALMVLGFARQVLCERVQFNALKAAYKLSLACDEMRETTVSEAMARKYATLGVQTVADAHVLGCVDTRLEFAAREYVAHYNEAFLNPV